MDDSRDHKQPQETRNRSECGMRHDAVSATDDRLHLDEDVRATDDFVRKSMEVYASSIRDETGDAIERICEASSRHLASNGLRLSQDEDSREFESDHRIERSSLIRQWFNRDRGLKFRRVAVVVAAVILTATLAVLFSTIRQNGHGIGNTGNLAERSNPTVSPADDTLLPLDDDDALEQAIFAMRDAISEFEDEVIQMNATDSDSYWAGNDLDDAIDVFEAEMDSF